MNEIDLESLVKHSALFSELDDTARKHLLNKFEQIYLKKDQVLYFQGDPSDSIYLVVEGKLSARLTTASGEIRTVGYINAGEIVGETGVLSGEPRTLTITAIKAANLLKLSAIDFIQLCHQYPSVMFATVRPIISRARSFMQMLPTKKNNRHIAILAMNSDSHIENFFNKISNLTEGLSSMLLVSELESELRGYAGETNVLKEKLQQLAQGKKSSQRLLYLLLSGTSTLAKIALKKANKIYLVVHSTNSTPTPVDRQWLDKILGKRATLPLIELIVLHPAGSSISTRAPNWFRQSHYGLIHHVREEQLSDYQRLLRFIRDKATGLVLSGGGTRGWAHLGVIKALEEAKMPIDMIGGSSVGAIVAACYALTHSFQAAFEKFYEIVVTSHHSTSWRSLTWPSISLFDAKKFTESLMSVFSDNNIEDLLVPFFCITSNLGNNSEAIHTSGIVWEKIRASSAIPGIVPPVLIEGQLHYDGGLLNNLPVDVMKKYVGDDGRIIAAELNSFSPDKHKYNFPPILTFKEMALHKFGIVKHNYRFPRFIDTFLHGLFVGALAKAQQNSLAANILISMDLHRFKMLHSNPQQADRLVEIGYEAARKQLMLYKKNKKAVSPNKSNNQSLPPEKIDAKKAV